MIYVLILFIGITVGLIISKLIDFKKAEVDKEFLNLVDKVIFEEKEEKKRIQIRYEKILEIKDDAEFKLQTGLKRDVFLKYLIF